MKKFIEPNIMIEEVEVVDIITASSDPNISGPGNRD